MTVKLLTEQHLELLSFKGGCTGLSESTHVKMPHCWQSHSRLKYSLTLPFSIFRPIVAVYWCLSTPTTCSTSTVWTWSRGMKANQLELYHRKYNRLYLQYSSRENLSSGFPTKRVSNQSPQPQRVARKLKFHL